MKDLLIKYKKLNIALSDEDERKLINEYIYFTNKLEGNKLSLAQTTTLIEQNKISGSDINLRDILEQKGMYSALNRLFIAIKNKEKLSANLMLELNWLVIGSYFKSDISYRNWKQKGQKENIFKIIENRIKVIDGYGKEKIIVPYSNPKTVNTNMELLVKKINLSGQDVFTKSAFLAQELWLHQPFIDGNKRTARLLINFLTMKEDYPLFVYRNQANNFNIILVNQFLYGKEGSLKNYIENEMKQELSKQLNQEKKADKNRGFGFKYLL